MWLVFDVYLQNMWMHPTLHLMRHKGFYKLLYNRFDNWQLSMLGVLMIFLAAGYGVFPI